jgi:tetratricopeptide (TPR) repeat protein
MSERLENAEDVARVGERIRLLIDAGQTPDALALADALEGGEVPVTHLRAYTYTEAGEADGDRALLEHGAALWRSLDGKTLDSSYNLGNAELALFEISARDDGHVAAFEQQRPHLHEARSCFARIGAQESLRDDVRLQALTNLGNSYSQMGRDLEAIDCWRRAFDIDPDFRDGPRERRGRTAERRRVHGRSRRNSHPRCRS